MIVVHEDDYVEVTLVNPAATRCPTISTFTAPRAHPGAAT
jgi:hypothetical protein